MPVVKHEAPPEAPPEAHASEIGSTHDGGVSDMLGHTHGVMAVEHTSIPALRKAPMSRMLSVA